MLFDLRASSMLGACVGAWVEKIMETNPGVRPKSQELQRKPLIPSACVPSDFYAADQNLTKRPAQVFASTPIIKRLLPGIVYDTTTDRLGTKS
jgi:hypothetical protein